MIAEAVAACREVAGWNWPAILASIVALLGIYGAHRFAKHRDNENRKRIRRGHFAALAAEVNEASRILRGYLIASLDRPSYRAPVFAFAASYPALLGDGAFEQEQSTAVLRFYTLVNSFNLGLNQAHEAHAAGNEKLVSSERDRLCIKAIKGLPRSIENPSFYDRVAEALVGQDRANDFVPLAFERLPDKLFVRMALRLQGALEARERDGYEPHSSAD